MGNNIHSIGIIGLGLIGKQRLRALLGDNVAPKSIYIFDPQIEKIKDEIPEGLNISSSLEELLELPLTHAVVSVPHSLAPGIVERLLAKNVIVLMEKPLGRNLKEAKELLRTENFEKLFIGFNYRFMPGVIALKAKIENGSLGKLISVRMDLGHGGAPGDEKTWKLSPDLAGGGALLDPGIHILDLLLYLFPSHNRKVVMTTMHSWRGFWKTGIEEFVNIIGEHNGIQFNLTSSIVSWRTRFHVEVIGTDGYFEVSGRGRSDGSQVTISGQRWGWLTSPSQIESELREVVAQNDQSLVYETIAWLRGGNSICTAKEGLEAMKLYAQILRLEVAND